MRNRTHIALTILLVLGTFAVWGCGSSSDTAGPGEPPDTTPKSGYIYTVVGTGSPGTGVPGQKPTSTELYWPMDMNFDSSGKLYVVDWNNHRILTLDDDGNIKLLVGGRFGDAPDGQADQIGLNHPTHVSFDPLGRLILTAWHNSLLKRMDMSTGYIATFCGDGRRSYGGDGGPAEDAVVDLPVTTIFDDAGRMYIGDQANMCVRMIDLSGTITTVVGTPTVSGYWGDGGDAREARLYFERGQAANPSGRICFSPDGRMFIADTGNNLVRCVDKSGVITRFAGQPPVYHDPPDIFNPDDTLQFYPGFSGDSGPAVDAKLRQPRDVAADSEGNIYIADTGNHCIRKVDTFGIITTIAGTPTASPPYGGLKSGVPATQAPFTLPYGVEIDRDDNIWIADRNNNAVRKIYK